MSFVGIPSDIELPIPTLDILSYLNTSEYFCIYFFDSIFLDIPEVNKMLMRDIILSTGLVSEDKLIEIKDLVDPDLIEVKAKKLYNWLLTTDGTEIFLKVINNIPQKYRPKKENASFEALKYEIIFILVCLEIKDNLVLLDRYGERLRSIIRSIRSNLSLIELLELKTNEEQSISIYKAPKPIKKDRTPLPYRISNIANTGEFEDWFINNNQVPFADMKSLEQIIFSGRNYDDTRFDSYISKTSGLNISDLNDIEAAELISLEIIVPFYRKLKDSIERNPEYPLTLPSKLDMFLDSL